MRKQTVFRWLAFVAILAMVATACGPAASPTPVVEVETVVVERTVEVPVTVAPPATEVPAPVTIVFQEPWSLDSDRGKVVQKIVSDFMAANPDIRVVIKDSGVKNEVFITEVLAGGAPDVVMFGEDGVMLFAPQDAFTDLTPYVETWDASKRDDFYKSVWTFGGYEGKQYGIPWIAHSMALIYNKGMFDAAGLDPNKPPKTWDELYDYATKLTSGEQYGYGLVGKQGHDMAWSWYDFVWQNGGDLATEKGGQWTVALNSPEALAALEFYIKLKDVAPPETTTTGGGEANTLFIQKRVAMYVLGPWAVAGVRKDAPDIQVGVAPLPYSKNAATTVGAGLLTVPRTTQNPEAAWRLIDYLTEVENQVKLVSTGFAFRIPTRQSAVQDAWFQQNPEYIPFVEGLGYGHVPTVLTIAKKYNQAHGEVVQPALSKAFIGELTPAEALAEMEANGNPLLK
ncbi:MAG: ABC transporter substrate-binding protein [Chloroflexi bacterium]|nr:ABC transporter substrate-binding protein [Chloroflexota bacterium]